MRGVLLVVAFFMILVRPQKCDCPNRILLGFDLGTVIKNATVNKTPFNNAGLTRELSKSYKIQSFPKPSSAPQNACAFVQNRQLPLPAFFVLFS